MSPSDGFPRELAPDEFRVDDPGHAYALGREDSSPVRLQFVRKERGADDELYIAEHGVTNEAVVGVLIDRVEHLNARLPCVENERVLGHLRSALVELQSRTRARVAQGVEATERPHEPE